MISDSIYSILSSNSDLSDVVSDRIYPIVATGQKEDLVFPFIVFTVTGLTPGYNRSNVSLDNVGFQVSLVDNVHDDCMTNIRLVRIALENQSGTYSGYKIYPIKIENYNESFNGDPYNAYVMTFYCSTQTEFNLT